FLSFDSSVSTSSFLYFSTAASPSEIYPLSLHDALPIWTYIRLAVADALEGPWRIHTPGALQHSESHFPDELDPQDPAKVRPGMRSEEHTSELQSREKLVCRLLLEKKKTY